MDASPNRKEKRRKKVVARRQEIPSTLAKTFRITKYIKPISPVFIAESQGIQLPSGTPFQVYARQNVDWHTQASSSSQTSDQELLIHSRNGKTEYIGREDRPSSDALPPTRHLIGLRDSTTGEMVVIEAKKMIVRASVISQEVVDPSEDKTVDKTMHAGRKVDQSIVFGTKKAKKAVHEKELNVSSSREHGANSGNFASGNGGSYQAMINAIGESTINMATREELQAIVDEAKPVPKVNPDAATIEDVYSPEGLIGSDILPLVPIEDWQEAIGMQQGLETSSQFVADRISQAAGMNDGAERQLRLLRYLLSLICFFSKTKLGPRHGPRVVAPDKELLGVLGHTPPAVMQSIRRRFSEGGRMRKFHVDLLMTHVCALAIIIDSFSVDTRTLCSDLSLTDKTMNAYFREIGAKVRQSTMKDESRKHYVATLSLPLTFPKQRMAIYSQR